MLDNQVEVSRRVVNLSLAKGPALPMGKNWRKKMLKKEISIF